MTILTTTQHSALGELQRYGSLAPSRTAWDKVTGRRAFSKRTLDALTVMGYADWRSDGAIVPREQTPKRFTTSYMDRAVFSLAEVIDKAKRDLRRVDFDTMVGTGFSGGLVIPTLALALDKKFVLIRKETDDSHHGKGRLLGEMGQRWIFVDDFVSSGATKRRVIEKITHACRVAGHPTAHVGDYLYTRDDQGFVPAVDAYTGYLG